MPLKSEICKMISLENIDKIVICTKNSTIVVINVFSNSVTDELNFSLFETNILIQSALAIPMRNDKSYELWLGSDLAQFYVFNLITMKITGVYNHYNSNSSSTLSLMTNDLVSIVKTTPKDGIYLWSYIYPSTPLSCLKLFSILFL
jgi:hypothetical protein